MFGYFEQKANEVWNVLAPVQTPDEKMFTSVETGNMQEVESALRAGISPNARNEAGNTLLNVACYNGQEAIVRRLMEAGGDLQATGSRGNTCMHFAAQRGHATLVRFLIEQGLSVTVRNAQGQNPYNMADGFALKQHLMQLVLVEEQKMGTAPVLSGVTRDSSMDQERLRNLAPPPMFGGPSPAGGQPSDASATTPGAPPPAGADDPNYRAPSVNSGIKEDGFVTSVGNPELSAKFGNTSQYRHVVSDAPGVSPTNAAPATPHTFVPSSTNSPFARGRYVNYDVGSGGPGAAHVPPPPQQPGYGAQQQQQQPGVFTPSPVANQQQQPGVFTPPPAANQQQQPGVFTPPLVANQQQAYAVPSPMAAAPHVPAAMPGPGYASPPNTFAAAPPGVPLAVAAPPPLSAGAGIPFQPRAVGANSPVLSRSPVAQSPPSGSPVSFSGVQTHGR